MSAGTSTVSEFATLPEECRAQLERILQSSGFDATQRERRFLIHVVNETLAGRQNRIKAYSIALEVFGRDASFDPQNDPIVRVDAGHLRRSLERYYLTAGQADPIVISIPKGGYVPVFLHQAKSPIVGAFSPADPDSAIATTPPRRHRTPWLIAIAGVASALIALLSLMTWNDFRPTEPELPRLLVGQFEDLSDTGQSAAIANGLTQEVIGQLASFKDIVVVESFAGMSDLVPPRYALLGSVSLSDKAFRLRVRFVNQKDGSVLWANNYDGDIRVGVLVKAQADIAKNVATTLAQSYGVISQADAALDVANPPEDWAAYSCTLDFYNYRVSLDLVALPAVRGCLEGAVRRFPNYATAWALLAQAYIDGVRFRFPYEPTSARTAIDQALAAARRAVELDPRNVRGLQAEMFGLYFNGEYDAARSVGEAARAINPNDTELMGEFGYRLSLAGEWEEGCKLLVEARARNPGPFAYYESALALCSHFAGDNATALMWIKKTTAPRNPLYHLIAAAIYGRAGEQEEARRAVDWMMANEPALVAGVRQEVSVRLRRSQDVEFFLDSLAMAGITKPAA